MQKVDRKLSLGPLSNRHDWVHFDEGVETQPRYAFLLAEIFGAGRQGGTLASF